MPVWKTVVGDTYDLLETQLKHGDGTLVNLSGLAASAVTFILDNRTAGAGTGHAAESISDAVNGKVRLAITANMVASARTYFVSVRVVFADGTQKTFPVGDPFRWTVT